VLPLGGRPISRFLTWSYLVVLLASVAWLLWRNPFPVLCFAVAVACWVAIARFTFRRKLRRLAAGRFGESEDTFVRRVDDDAIDISVARAVYVAIQDYLNSEFPNFPLHESDRLMADLKIDEGDLDDLVADKIAPRAGRSTQGAPSNPYFGNVHTVDDLMRFLSAQPPTNNDESPVVVA